MFIYVDESGTFAHSTKSDSWCIVAGYVVPEIARKAVEETLSPVSYTHLTLPTILRV